MADEVAAEKVETKPTLTQVIEKAAVETTKNIGDAIVNEEKQTKESKEDSSEKVETKIETKVEDKEELSEVQLTAAKNLFKALNNQDPNVQKQAVKILATAAGLDLKEVETKTEVKELKKDLVALLKEGLGEFDFLADKLGPVLEKAIKGIIEEATEPTKKELNEIKLEKQKETYSKAIDNVFAKYENAIELATDVRALQDQFPPTKNLTTEQYFEKLIKLAAAEKEGFELKKTGDKTTKRDEAKISKNRNDVGSRLASERGTDLKTAVKVPGKMNLNEAVANAIEVLAAEKG